MVRQTKPRTSSILGKHSSNRAITPAHTYFHYFQYFNNPGLVVLPSPSPKSWDCRHVPLCLVSAVLRPESGAPCTIGILSTEQYLCVCVCRYVFTFTKHLQPWGRLQRIAATVIACVPRKWAVGFEEELTSSETAGTDWGMSHASQQLWGSVSCHKTGYLVSLL